MKREWWQNHNLWPLHWFKWQHKEKINIMTNQDIVTNMARRRTSGDDINARSHANVTNITSNEYYQDSVPITIQGYMIHPVESPDFWGTSCSTLTAIAIPRIKTGFIHKSWLLKLHCRKKWPNFQTPIRLFPASFKFEKFRCLNESRLFKDFICSLVDITWQVQSSWNF